MITLFWVPMASHHELTLPAPIPECSEMLYIRFLPFICN